MVIAFLIGTAYITEKTAQQRGVRSGKIIRIIDQEKLVSLLGVEVLKELQKNPAGKTIGPPTLIRALTVSGVEDYSALRIKGSKEKTSLIVPEQDITPELIFCFTRQGTVNLCRQDKSHILVRDVNEIDIIRGKL